jgi:hypothetical protein
MTQEDGLRGEANSQVDGHLIASPQVAESSREPSQGGDTERYYAAFVNDLQQNNVEAVWHAPEPVVDTPRRPGVP